MSERGGAFSRNPNMCASCSSMADGMGDETGGRLVQEQPRVAGETESVERPHTADHPGVHLVE
jgi:hypothetical protein